MALRVRVVFASTRALFYVTIMGGTGASIIFAGICSILFDEK